MLFIKVRIKDLMKSLLNYAISFFCALFFGINSSSAQQDTTLNVYTGQSEITASRRITLSSGFYIPSGKKVRIFIVPNSQTCIPLASNPSNDQNYISTRVFKIPKVLTDKDANSNARSTCEVNQTIQYFDGLGRPLQTVLVQGSPGFADVVQPVIYDAFGRESIKYLPYAVTSNGGTYRKDAIKGQSTFYNGNQTGLTNTAFPFSQTSYEFSPLNRVTEMSAPGASWNLASGHTQKIEYGTNIANDVKLWTISGNGAKSTYYDAGKLYKTTTKDENWISTDLKAGTTDEYKDLAGRIVLKRNWESNTKSLSIYYVYDDQGNLNYVLPPAVNENGLNTVNTFDESNDVYKQFIYGYHYDGRKRLIEKKVPGKGWESMVYNKLDQLVLRQDVNQQGKEWIFTKYDAFGRVVSTGVCKDTGDRAALQAKVDSQNTFVEKRVATGIGYDNSSFPQVIDTYYVINYYDDYNFPGNTFGSATGDQVGAGRTMSLLTGTKVNTLGTKDTLLSVHYYDSEGRVVQTKSFNHLGGKDVVDNTYNFVGELKISTRSHTGSSTGAATTIAMRYTYDHMGRKSAVMESINGQDEVVLSRSDYTETGQLVRKQLHSTDREKSFLQKTDYEYNERGWLNKSSSDQFSLQLKYNDGNTPQWNGNIANQLWGSKSDLRNNFNYTYDKLNRLTLASSANLGESIVYDVMGNITSLTRDGYGTNKYTGYTGNQLTKIEGFTNSTYIYNDNGNLTSDEGKGIKISYNSLNLPDQITGAQTISYIYDATGRKLRKVSKTEGTTDYVDGIQYLGGKIDIITTEEGLARNNKGIYSYEYTLTDHLGNNRATFYRNPSGGIEILQRDDYFAFGLRKPIQIGANDNKYLYNKKELQEELGEYDYGARFYDPVIGRWGIPDPLADMYDHLSPYNYGINNPIRFTDPDGMAVEDQQEEPPKKKTIQLKEVNITASRIASTASIALPLTRPISLPGSKISAPALPNPFFIFVGLLLWPTNMNDQSSDRITRDPIVYTEKTVEDLEAESEPIKIKNKKNNKFYKRKGGMTQADKDYDALGSSVTGTIPEKKR
ncbi:hypothetical protein TH53_10330 [Pedobacter lusitanus]|uniref:DUF6443 domain-containing protein n=2 Tax=Pedobacter lusitanus TaxID=1503925 RepID=A0A0D0F6K7_9SPHI|nr:hypothetical protein TH53_10330 [Pedobacter lusitanus]